MFELSTALGLYQTDLLDHTHVPQEHLERRIWDIKRETKELLIILDNPERATEMFNKLKTAIESVYFELSRTLPIRRLVFAGSSGQVLQELLLSHKKAQEKHPLAAKRLQKPLFVTGDQNKRIKHQLGVSTLIPPLAIIIDDYAESMSKAETYLPEIFPGRSMFVMAMAPKEKLGSFAQSQLKRYSIEQRFKIGSVDSKLTDFMKLVSGLASEVVRIQTGGEYWKSVKDFEYRWDPSKLTPEQTEIVTGAAAALEKLRVQFTAFLSQGEEIAETRGNTV